MHGVSDMSGGSFPLAGTAHPVSMLAPVVHQPGPTAGPHNDKPTAAQAAAGRLQRASARQAAKAAQQQKRQAQARAAAAAKRGNGGAKRTRDEEVPAEEDDQEGAKRGFVFGCSSFWRLFLFLFSSSSSKNCLRSSRTFYALVVATDTAFFVLSCRLR